MKTQSSNLQSPFSSNKDDEEKVQIVTLDYYHFETQEGFVAEPLFDWKGENVPFILNWGHYLPGFHEVVASTKPGEEVKHVLIDAGYGDRKPEMIFHVSKDQLEKVVVGMKKEQFKANTSIKLPQSDSKEGIPVLITDVNDETDTVTLDANHPLAGSSYSCSLKVKSIEYFDTTNFEHNDHNNNNNKYEMATFALGCFWGAELAYMRVPGVVGTRVGYSQGITANPTYTEVCNGTTKHREVVQVIYRPDVVTYKELVQVAVKRLQETTPTTMTSLFELFDNEEEDEEEDSQQYKHGFYYHNEKQRAVAMDVIAQHSSLKIELLQASTFWRAEDYHQKYLYKGGQSARKGCREKIRCFG